MRNRLSANISHYSLANILVTVAGLISFPLLTRLLSVQDYGVINLVTTALGLALALGKLGLQHSTVRFQAEQEAVGTDEARARFLATVYYGMAAAGAAATVVLVGVALLAPDSWWNGTVVVPFLLLASPLVLVRALESAAVNQLRAQERSVPLSVYTVLRRYITLVLTLLALVWIARDLWGFFGATLLGEGLGLALLLVWLFRQQGVPRPGNLSPDLLKAMLAYGLPMLGYEAATIILSMGDRYVIQRSIGPAPLGVYAASYNLCEYVRQALLAAMTAAAFPAALRLWEREGAAATQQFVRGFLHAYAAVASLVVAGTAAIGPQLMTLLASDKYRSGAEVVPWIMAGMALDSAAVLLGLGLYLRKRSKIVMLLVLGTALLNIGLNLWWVPMLGIAGAAMAMFFSYLALVSAQLLIGRSVMAVPLPVVPVVGYGLLGWLMYQTVTHLHLQNDLATMVLRIVAGLLLYGGAAAAADPQARQRMLGALNTLARRRPPVPGT